MNTKALNKWMRETFGVYPANPNHIHITGAQGGEGGKNFPELTQGIKGIFSLVSTDNDWASGYADIIENGSCSHGCHFYEVPPAPIDYIDIWKLD